MKFTDQDLKKLWKPRKDSSGEDNGQITIIGGSRLFHGAPMLAVKAASRLVDMVFFGSPERDLEKVAKLNSFIWIPWEDMEEYVAKSEAILIGPGMMRYRKNLPEGVFDEAGTETRMLTQYLLGKYKDKKWVIDGGSLQTIDRAYIPKNSILTPNKYEYEILFGDTKIEEAAKKHKCVIISKGPVAIVTDGETTYEVRGGNAGLTKGGTGDVLAGIIVGLAAKNPPLLAAAVGAYVVKKTAEKLFLDRGYGYNADDVADRLVFPA